MLKKKSTQVRKTARKTNKRVASKRVSGDVWAGEEWKVVEGRMVPGRGRLAKTSHLFLCVAEKLRSTALPRSTETSRNDSAKSPPACTWPTTRWASLDTAGAGISSTGSWRTNESTGENSSTTSSISSRTKSTSENWRRRSSAPRGRR